jgi:hypothetical protein
MKAATIDGRKEFMSMIDLKNERGIMPLLESPYREYEMRPTVPASAARHQPDRQPSKLMLNFGSWAGRLHAVLGGAYR